MIDIFAPSPPHARLLFSTIFLFSTKSGKIKAFQAAENTDSE